MTSDGLWLTIAASDDVAAVLAASVGVVKGVGIKWGQVPLPLRGQSPKTTTLGSSEHSEQAAIARAGRNRGNRL